MNKHMQQLFFTSIPSPMRERQVFPSSGLFTKVDEERLRQEESDSPKWYCVRVILYEHYLWDMRCWHKPKYQYSKDEIISHIHKWLKDHEQGNWTYNCGHCVYCMRKLLDRKEATIEEIAELVKRNNNIKYLNLINTWNNGFEEEKGV